MYSRNLSQVLPDEMPAVQPGATSPVFMFGTFDPANGTSRASIHAVDEAMLGIRENVAMMAAAIHRHHHPEVAADASSRAFMFGGHPEQPPAESLNALPEAFWATETD
jgi:hypothetical protein